jgi:hypothetical protein
VAEEVVEHRAVSVSDSADVVVAVKVRPRLIRALVTHVADGALVLLLCGRHGHKFSAKHFTDNSKSILCELATDVRDFTYAACACGAGSSVARFLPGATRSYLV